MPATVFSSFSDNGLYKLKVIADPNPSSAKERKDKILLNNPFSPRYSADNT